MRRAHNEDNFGVLEDEALVLVADGMGGHAAGEVASSIAIASVGHFYHQANATPGLEWPFERMPELSPVENRLVCGFKIANQRIHKAATTDKGRRGMGTTLVAAAIVADEICIAHVGDSRAYRIYSGGIEKLTRDHSLLEQFKEINPGMTREEESRFPHKNVITRALGLNETVDVDVSTHRIAPGERHLLCSDGLSGHVTDEEMVELLAGATDLRAAVAGLVDRANSAGGNDNITAIVLAHD